MCEFWTLRVTPPADGEPQAHSPGVQGTTGKATRAPAMEVVPPSVHAPGTTSGTPETGESPA
eukprot:157977-Pyramimonas_sp.AAC.1